MLHLVTCGSFWICIVVHHQVSHGVTTASDETGEFCLSLQHMLIVAWRKLLHIWHYHKFSGKKTDPLQIFHADERSLKQNSVTIIKPSVILKPWTLITLLYSRSLLWLRWHVVLLIYWVKMLFGTLYPITFYLVYLFSFFTFRQII